jgi:hypothetical protein
MLSSHQQVYVVLQEIFIALAHYAFLLDEVQVQAKYEKDGKNVDFFLAATW